MATLHIPALLRELVGGADRVTVALGPEERVTVRTLLERADAQHAGLLEALTYGDDLMPGIAVFVGEEQALLGLDTRVHGDVEVHFLPPIVGGR